MALWGVSIVWLCCCWGCEKLSKLLALQLSLPASTSKAGAEILDLLLRPNRLAGVGTLGTDQFVAVRRHIDAPTSTQAAVAPTGLTSSSEGGCIAMYNVYAV